MPELKEKEIPEKLISPFEKIKLVPGWVPETAAGRVIQFTLRHCPDYLALFSQVQNRVLAVNPNFSYFPLRLEPGKPSPLGLFLEERYATPANLPEENHALEVWPDNHKRSALLGRVVFADNAGRRYRDIDLKGIGMLTPNGVNLGSLIRGGPERTGLLSLERAEHDFQMSEEFWQLGIRAHRVLAIIKLGEIVVAKRKFTLAEAIKEGLLDERFEPVIAVRAFGTKARVEDLVNPIIPRQFREPLFEDAKSLITQEFGPKTPLSSKDYLVWFAQTLGKNVGLMHKNGWHHNYLTFHNLTLDCRIVDLDTISPLTSEDQRKEDFDSARATLIHGLFKGVLFLEGLTFDEVADEEWMELTKHFENEYNAVFSPLEQQRLQPV